MIFKVENLGPVERAEIDLSKDLILLTGPNGTGKTYVAWAVYGLLQTWQERSLFLDLVLMLPDLGQAADRLLASGASDFDLAELTREFGPEVIRRVADIYSQRIADHFAAESRLFELTRVQLEPGDDAWRTDFAMIGRSPSFPTWGFSSSKKEDSTRVSIQVAKEESLFPLERLPREEHATFRQDLIGLLATWLFHARRHLAPAIFPAERIATTMFWRELSLKRVELVEQVLVMQDRPAKAVEQLRSQAQRFPRPIQDSLMMAGDLERWKFETSEFADLADYLEEHLLRGKMHLSPYGQLLFLPAQRPDVVLGVHVTASMVKSLSLLVFYLRHMAKADDMVIIDEPELNLHPDNQRLIARVLARAVNRGLKVMASTHSDYLIRELNNLIMLGQDTEAIHALRAKHGYEEAELLKPSQLGVYLFQNGTAEVVPVDEAGFAVATIDDEINKLNAVSQEIYAALLEQEP
jgi:energy-coupling factor transporter ATP-binding protein EcfA2